MNRFILVIFSCSIFFSCATVKGQKKLLSDRVGLNFVRPDINRPGEYAFSHNYDWLLKQYTEMGVKWNRLAFSWNRIEPEKEQFNWTKYDSIVDYCHKNGINVIATLGGHFDRPPVPKWAGESLSLVLHSNPEYLYDFVTEWVKRYKDKIDYWEILNEPNGQHIGLTIKDYVDLILKPSYQIIKKYDPKSQVLPCDYWSLPGKNREYFWKNAKDYCDIYNIHIYTKSAINEIRWYSKMLPDSGVTDKKFWVTETGLESTGGAAVNQYLMQKNNIPTKQEARFLGKEIVDNAFKNKQDSIRAEWIKDLFPKALAVERCEKIFLWGSLEEYEGGFDKDAYYDRKNRQFDLWAIFTGDFKWTKTAVEMKKLLKQ